ncbi:MAG: hypothetical protein ACREMB_03655 [Candidatus Rokuibacteriota bacterium]
MSVGTGYAVIVRRGERAIFEDLEAHAGELGLNAVIWDRRVRDRRVIIRDVRTDRRRGERRGQPGPTWEALGFTIVRQAGAARAGEYVASGRAS